MRVLGVDPGLTRCGLGVVEGTVGRPMVLRHVEVVTTSPEELLPDRLLRMSDVISAVVTATAPDVVVIERMFSQHNVRTVMGTAQASATAVLAAASAGLPVVWFTPSEVKAAVTGNGRATKAQVAGMVVRILKLPAAPKPVDATDALALAICQMWRGSAQARISRAVSAAPPARIPPAGRRGARNQAGTPRSAGAAAGVRSPR